ncbi:hypothetical protein MMC34_008640 [Xylographa carneopallida]|nr:hypothetical protein [Xylographa carneopallida]
MSSPGATWSAALRQRRAKCMPYQLLRQKAFSLVTHGSNKGPSRWDADLDAATFAMTYAQQPQHDLRCSNGDLQIISTWDRGGSGSVLLSHDNPHMLLNPALQTLTRQLRAEFGQPDWHSIPELHVPQSELQKVDDSEGGALQLALSLVALDIANAHTDREWVLYIADTAHLAIRQTPSAASPTAQPLTNVTASPQWQQLVASPMAVIGVFRDCIMEHGITDHLKAFRSYATRIGWQLQWTEQQAAGGGAVTGTTVLCGVPRGGENGATLSFDAQNRLTNFQVIVNRENVIDPALLP